MIRRSASVSSYRILVREIKGAHYTKWIEQIFFNDPDLWGANFSSLSYLILYKIRLWVSFVP